jgi:hypothetical protein
MARHPFVHLDQVVAHAGDIRVAPVQAALLQRVEPVLLRDRGATTAGFFLALHRHCPRDRRVASLLQ